MLLKRHFIAVAKILARERVAANSVIIHATVDAIARSLADLFVSENPRFDRGRFYAAVGIGMEPNLSIGQVCEHCGYDHDR